MLLIIVSLLSLLYMLHSFLNSFNYLLQSNNKLGMGLPLNPSTNHNINEVYQLLPKNKLSWRELCTKANLTIQSKLSLW